MFVRKIHLGSMFTFAFCMIFNWVTMKFFPNIFENPSVSYVMFFIFLLSILSLWFTPIVRCILNKEIKNRYVWMLISFIFPVFGGFFLYFVIKEN